MGYRQQGKVGIGRTGFGTGCPKGRLNVRKAANPLPKKVREINLSSSNPCSMTIRFQNHKNQLFQLSDDVAKTDSPYQIPEHLRWVNEKAAALLKKKDKHTEKKLTAWIAENPGVPQLKNYLTVYYSAKGQTRKAFDYNRETAKQHPGYLFAKINLALEALEGKAPEKVLDVLGPSLDLQALYPERKIFHVGEYVGFYKIVFRYFEAREELDNARPVFFDLQKLEEEFDDDFALDELQSVLVRAGLKGMVDSIARQKEFAATVRTAPTLPQTTEAPPFHFLQIQWLYENGAGIERGKIKELLSLRRSLLIEDLAAVVRDAIRRYDYFSEKDYAPETHNFIVHALLLLQALGAHEGLPALLEFLRQPEELLDYWLSDLITEDIWHVVYALGGNSLPALEEFLKEPLNYTYARSAVSTAISQVVLHRPEKREEVVGLYKRLLAFYYENKASREVCDHVLNSFIIGDITDFNGTELTGEMKRFYDEGLVDEFIEGKWDEVFERLNTADADRKFSRKRKVQDIYALLDELHRIERRAADKKDEEEYEDEYGEDDDFADYEEVNTEGGTLLYSGSEPYRREEKKIGRNDPCPCGSGLKYKKCHGKNE